MRSGLRTRVVGAVAARATLVVLAAAVAACGGPTGSASPSLSPTASILPPASTGISAAPDAVSSPVVGVVVAIDSTGLGSVSGFTLRLAGGQQVRFQVRGPLQNASQFPLGHLAEHLATAAPVRVSFSRSGDLLVVYRIEDAG